MQKLKFVPLALLALSYSVFAQQIPNAGNQLQQIPPIPTPEQTAPKLIIEPRSVAPSPTVDTAQITVNRLSITGASVYSEAELLAVTDFEPGSVQTLTELRGMAAKIADHYHRNGYFVAQAYLPAQDIKNGAVTIAVIEGRYGKVVLQNRSSLSDGVANRILNGLNSGDIIASAPLESRLLLLSDLPGVSVKSTLIPGAAPGTSDLIVELHPGKTISGSVDADNAGSRYTGEYRVGATVNLNNLAGLGDVASLRVLTSGSGLNYARISYQVPFGKAVVGAAYSYLTYSLGREFESLDANGTAEVATLYGSYSLIRSRNTNLSANLALDAKTFQDRVGLSSVTDKKVQALTASLTGDHRDNFAGGGVSAYSLAWTTGNLDIETPIVRTIDAATAQSNGHYNKLGFNAMRLQNVTDRVSLYGAISGQLASKNLDVSEKMSLGGMYGVRAYPVGEAYADEGYLLTLEARLLLPKFSQQMPGQMHLIAFVDSGSVRINKNVWDSSTDNRRTLSGGGIGLNWIDPGNFAVRTYYARKIGNEAATSAPDASGRFWIQAVKYF